MCINHDTTIDVHLRFQTSSQWLFKKAARWGNFNVELSTELIYTYEIITKFPVLSVEYNAEMKTVFGPLLPR
jgi:hypothetical protein